MRLFVAINLGAEERKLVYEAGAPLRDANLPVRWVDEDGIHLTLKFLGEVQARAVGALEQCLAEVAAKATPFETVIRGFGAFPTPRRPRVIWVAADATPELRLLKLSLETELVRLGFEREMRSFKPHITLGRAKDSGDGGGRFRGVEEMMAQLDFQTVIEVETIDLMRSQLSPSGASYEVLKAVALGPVDEDE